MAPLRQQDAASSLGSGGGGSKGFRGGLATAPSPRSLSTDSDRPRHRRKCTTANTGGRPRSGSLAKCRPREPTITTRSHDYVPRPFATTRVTRDASKPTPSPEG
ncbi:hypothetical protein FIBSPDRAFT_850946 [Athelia psychrophila]|uniref:Uncharacterized protein n=1 Tax=Athelia psychrophila TaxID=1759441 RepID=A0A166T5D4_9AGAM|nr:hypothetical protein FIBSPDRAFT_850946 [Fibularhizoctonia sp. CBS 109695]